MVHFVGQSSIRPLVDPALSPWFEDVNRPVGLVVERDLLFRLSWLAYREFDSVTDGDIGVIGGHATEQSAAVSEFHDSDRIGCVLRERWRWGVDRRVREYSALGRLRLDIDGATATGVAGWPRR